MRRYREGQRKNEARRLEARAKRERRVWTYEVGSRGEVVSSSPPRGSDSDERGVIAVKRKRKERRRKSVRR